MGADSLDLSECKRRMGRQNIDNVATVDEMVVFAVLNRV